MNHLTTTTHTLQMRTMEFQLRAAYWGDWRAPQEGYYFDAKRAASEGHMATALRLAGEAFEGHNAQTSTNVQFRVETLTRTVTAHTLEEMG